MSEEKIGKGALLVPGELGLILWVDLKSKVDAKDFEKFIYKFFLCEI